MAITDYTTYDQVRALLGVHDLELSDTTLALPMYSTQLELELLAVDATLIDVYTAALAEPSPTALQTRFINVVSLYATYVVAVHALVAAPYFAERRLTDGNAEKERNVDPFEKVAENISTQLPTILARLRALFQALLGAAPVAEVIARRTRTLYVGTGIATDPVTG